MGEDMDTLAARANQMTKDPGFIHCSVESYDERLLAFEFDNTHNAHSFQLGRQMLGMKASIPNDRQTTVLVKQP